MEKFLGRQSENFYAVMRIVLGAAFAFHGLQKLFGIFGAKTAAMFSQSWFGGLIELVCGALISLGLFTGWAAFLACGTMAVAYIQFHWKGQVDRNFWPAINKGELAVVYCFVFLYIAAKGSGKLSLDSRRRAR